MSSDPSAGPSSRPPAIIPDHNTTSASDDSLNSSEDEGRMGDDPQYVNVHPSCFPALSNRAKTPSYLVKYSTKSIYGSEIEYPVENNRRYASSGPDAYFMPNDEAEQTRLNIIHQVYLMLLNGELTTAPIESPRRILDIGCGTGDWAI